MLNQVQRFRPADLELTHVADIEQTGSGAHSGVFLDDAAVLDGHFPSAEWN
jgi:hypothetical protein